MGFMSNLIKKSWKDSKFTRCAYLQEETEEDMDLWDAASLDYPGRQSPRNLEDWEQQEQFYENEDVVFFDEPRYINNFIYK